MDTHYGKYQGPLAALTESWMLDGDHGDYEWSDGEGEGFSLWVTGRGAAVGGLSWEDGRALMGDDFECSLEDLDALNAEMASARGVVGAWDSQGFVYGWTLSTLDDLAEAMTHYERIMTETNEAAEAAEMEDYR